VYQKFSVIHPSTNLDTHGNLATKNSQLMSPQSEIGGLWQFFNPRELQSKLKPARHLNTTTARGGIATILENKELWKLPSSKEPSSHGMSSPSFPNNLLSPKSFGLNLKISRSNPSSESNLKRLVENSAKELEDFKLKYYPATRRLGVSEAKSQDSIAESHRKPIGAISGGSLDLDTRLSPKLHPIEEHNLCITEQFESAQLYSVIKQNKLLVKENTEIMKENQKLKRLLVASRYSGAHVVEKAVSPSNRTKKSKKSRESQELISADELALNSSQQGLSQHQASPISCRVVDFSSHHLISSDGFKSLIILCHDYIKMAAKAANSPFGVMLFHDTEVIEAFCDLYPK
jgi:hypothetical protein